ncbi:MAG TPA: GxxExxY protein [Candidatus Angelobacter sp.]|nr:GxxExxY protein [Candidatus Angelobacter sp.]
MEKNPNYKHSELSEVIIGVFYDVYNELGFGFLESVYRKSFALALRAKGPRVKEELPISVYFRGTNVGDFKADLVVNDLILVELKTADTLAMPHEAQVLNYLRATSLEVGLLFNFGPKPQLRRLLFDNERKKARSRHVGDS